MTAARACSEPAWEGGLTGRKGSMGAGFLSTPLAQFVKAAPGLMPLSEQDSLMAAQNRCESLTGSEHICH